MIIHSKSGEDTDKLADYLARKILTAGSRNKAVVVSLIGELGAGKTHFTKAFMKSLGIKETILSPTFNIMKIYEIPSIKHQASGIRKFKNVYHVDAYRIKSKDLLDLGWNAIINDPANIVLIEWADIVKDILPEDALKIDIEHTEDEQARKIKLS